MSALVQGITLGLAMIVPIGAQNAFVLNQGIHRQHHLMVALICILCDIALIAFGVFGSGVVIKQWPWLLQFVTAGGILFLAVYGSLSLRSAWQSRGESACAEIEPTVNDVRPRHHVGRWAVIGATLAVTLLNPHVYLDTVVILGSIGNQLLGHERWWFALGCLLASCMWFTGLSLGAARFSPVLRKPKIKQSIDFMVGVIMWLLAGQLSVQLLAS